MLTDKQISSILEMIYKRFYVKSGAEITVECNPESIEDAKMKGYKKAGVNRISIGVQSLNNEILEIIGRIHDEEEVYKKFEIVERYFDNISVDMMFGLPKQTIKDIENDITKVVKVLGNKEKLKHVSFYSLILEEGTRFWNNKKIEEILPKEEEERKMYEKGKEILEKNGYIGYEISNYAKEGYFSRHNMNCWMQKEYFGFGIGASSYFRDLRYTNERVITRYIEKYLKYENKENEEKISKRYISNFRYNIEEKKDKIENYIYSMYYIIEKQSDEEKLKEKVILALRTSKGIYVDEKIKENVKIIKALEKYIKLKLLKRDKNYIYLTEEGKNYANIIWQELI